MLLLWQELVVRQRTADVVCLLGQEDFGLPGDALQITKQHHTEQSKC